MSSDKSPAYIEVDGFLLPEEFIAKCFRFATTFKPEPDDVVLATYPKCGTTWMSQIVMLILQKGEYHSLTPDQYFKSFPFLEFHGEDGIRKRLKPGCIKTHLPYNRLNFIEHAKYIYVARHPRDCLISFYYHTLFFPTYRFSDGTFDDFFKLFIKGKVDFNDYFDNLLSWYGQRHRQNIFFITYESMKADARGSIKKVADFLGCPLTELQLDQVVQYSSFEHMERSVGDVFENFSATSINEEVENRLKQLERKAEEDGFKQVGKFVRKGEVGGGKVKLSEEQEKQLKDRIWEKTKGTDVMSLWKET